MGRCHLLLDDADFVKLRSLSSSSSTDSWATAELVRRAFEDTNSQIGPPSIRRKTGGKPGRVKGAKRVAPGSGPEQRALCASDLTTELDLNEETVETVLSYLQVRPGGNLSGSSHEHNAGSKISVDEST